MSQQPESPRLDSLSDTSDKPLSSRPPAPPTPRHQGRKAALAVALLALATGVALFNGPAMLDRKQSAYNTADYSLDKVDSSLRRVGQPEDSVVNQAPAPAEAPSFAEGDSRGNSAGAPPGAPAVSRQAYSSEAKQKSVDGLLPPLSAGEPDASRLRKDEATMTLPNLPDGGDFGHGYNVSGYLIKQASLSVEVGDIQASFGKISDLSERYKGYLVDSSLSHPEHGQSVATLHLKLPTASLTAALAELDALGTVRSKQIRTEDIWLRLKQQQLEIEKRSGDVKAIKAGASQRDQQYRLKLEQLERVRLEQMLRMATVELQLHEKPAFIELAPLGDELGRKLTLAISNSLRLLADVATVLPPLLIFLGLAWLGWLTLRHVLVTRLALVQPRALAGIYLLGIVFFPLAAAGQGLLGMALGFGLLLGALWSLMTLARYIKAQVAAKAVVTAAAPAPAAPDQPV